MLSCQKHLFNLEEDIAYINGAYMSPLLNKSELAGHKGISMKVRPYNLTGVDFFDTVIQLKKAFAQLINAPDFERVALIPATSYGISNAAENVCLNKGDEILILEDQFPSNYYPWKKVADRSGATLKIIAAPNTLKHRGELWNEALLEAINDRTAAVAIAPLHWADGTLFDLERLSTKTKAHNALLILDGTQAIGAIPFDVQKTPVDAIISGSYKWLLGPYGFGLAYYGEYFDNGRPIEENWINRKDSENFAGLVDYKDTYKPMAARYSVGEQSNFAYVQMQLVGIEQIEQWGLENIQLYCKDLFAEAIPELEALGCWVEKESFRANHLFGIRLGENMQVEKLQAAFQKNKVIVSTRGNAIRISPHVYNDIEDIYRLLTCFREASV